MKIYSKNVTAGVDFLIESIWRSVDIDYKVESGAITYEEITKLLEKYNLITYSDEGIPGDVIDELDYFKIEVDEFMYSMRGRKAYIPCDRISIWWTTNNKTDLYERTKMFRKELEKTILEKTSPE